MLSNNTSPLKKVSYYFSFVMVALYIVIALVFLFTDAAIETFPVYREAVGGILLVYAVFRIFVIIKRNRREEQ
jgi:membrane protein YdbS with pleckstrin-like domain